MRVISRPSHGVVSFVQGEGKLTVGRTHCTSGKVPKLGVFYTPTAHFSGTDTIEVVASGILKGDYERIKFLVKSVSRKTEWTHGKCSSRPCLHNLWIWLSLQAIHADTLTF